MQNDYVKTFVPIEDKGICLKAYKRWKEALAMILNNN